MKKLFILFATTATLAIVSCGQKEEKAEAQSVETAVQQMTEAVADTSTVATVDSVAATTAPAAH